MAGEGIEQANVLAPAQEHEEALGGDGKHLVAGELREVRLDALAGGDVEEAAAEIVIREPLPSPFPEHDPPPRVEPTVWRARIRGAAAPPGSCRAEADVVGDVVGKEEIGDEPRRPVREIRPALHHPATWRRGFVPRSKGAAADEERRRGSWAASPTGREEDEHATASAAGTKGKFLFFFFFF